MEGNLPAPDINNPLLPRSSELRIRHLWDKEWSGPELKLKLEEAQEQGTTERNWQDHSLDGTMDWNVILQNQSQLKTEPDEDEEDDIRAGEDCLSFAERMKIQVDAIISTDNDENRVPAENNLNIPHAAPPAQGISVQRSNPTSAPGPSSSQIRLDELGNHQATPTGPKFWGPSHQVPDLGPVPVPLVQHAPTTTTAPNNGANSVRTAPSSAYPDWIIHNNQYYQRVNKENVPPEMQQRSHLAQAPQPYQVFIHQQGSSHPVQYIPAPVSNRPAQPQYPIYQMQPSQYYPAPNSHGLVPIPNSRPIQFQSPFYQQGPQFVPAPGGNVGVNQLKMPFTPTQPAQPQYQIFHPPQPYQIPYVQGVFYQPAPLYQLPNGWTYGPLPM